jgi:hypothetical protein
VWKCYVSLLNSVIKIYARIIASRIKPLTDAIFQMNKHNLDLEGHEKVISLLLNIPEENA